MTTSFGRTYSADEFADEACRSYCIEREECVRGDDDVYDCRRRWNAWKWIRFLQWRRWSR